MKVLILVATMSVSVAGLLQYSLPSAIESQRRALQTSGGGFAPLRGWRRRGPSKEIVPARNAMMEAADSEKKLSSFEKVSDVLTNLFPIWTVLFSVWGLARPSDFAWLTTEYFTAGLAVLMISMGLTMTPKDFVRVASRPGSVLVNFLLCYGFMPMLGLILGKTFQLEPALVAGLVLVGSINGGQASNLCTYIARGNVALSVLMTTATTIGAIVMTPFLCQKFLGTVVPVDALGIVISTLQVVLGPIIFGMGANVIAPKVVKKFTPVLPLIGVSSTCLLVASSVGQVAGPIKAAGLALQIPVFLLHFLGGICGYWIARFLGFGETTCRTMAIETSMKSSAFGFLLAKLHMGAEAARVPSAVSVVWMALTGSTLAVIWRFIPVPKGKDEDKK
uniref:Bile acid:sodium symporter n=1 Tax=Aureoumbra lagunensis TaxID=44058 RepID=A0A7S3NPW1_9STRA|mmetsp:Transcript_19029/g.28758  ORF Transcript_19029/g.28758 Transcript_19029/m.28758 type:complete len:391 (+) Transcript_19029:62-1234(+)